MIQKVFTWFSIRHALTHSKVEVFHHYHECTPSCPHYEDETTILMDCLYAGKI